MLAIGPQESTTQREKGKIMDQKQLRNTLLLVCGAFIWGTAFVAQSVGSDYMGPYTFLAGRSWLACAFLLGLMAVLRKMGRTNTAAEPGFWQNKKVLVRAVFSAVRRCLRRQRRSRWALAPPARPRPGL